MFKVFRRLASLKITLVGMVLLISGSMLMYGNPADVPVWVVVIPLAFMAVNLTAAIISNKRINHQPGLLVFHVCLLGLVILAGIGRLTHLDAHTEIPIGTAFGADRLLEVRTGVWHSGNLDQVTFVQGPYTVQYAPGLRRGLTHSHVLLKDAQGQWIEKVIGDDRVLVIEGYRFYTTHNKGFTTLLTWTPDGGQPITGVVNMPSYPLFDYKQDNEWTPPGTQQVIKFWLQIDAGLTLEKAWTLDARNSSAVLVVTNNDIRQELHEGETVKLPGGELKFDKLTMWMGYRIFYDPTIQWMFFIAVAGVLGLGFYFWRKINLQPWTEEALEEASQEKSKEPLKEPLKETMSEPLKHTSPLKTALTKPVTTQHMSISQHSGHDLAAISKGQS
jgi:cytochrome c biogenesis protein